MFFLLLIKKTHSSIFQNCQLFKKKAKWEKQQQGTIIGKITGSKVEIFIY